MNGGKETGDSLGGQTAQFSLTECLSNYLTQWKRSQNITAKYLWNKMYNSAWTWHDAWAPHGPHGLWPGGSGRIDSRRRPEPEGGPWEQGGRWWWGTVKTSARSTKMGPDAKSGGMAKGVFEPTQRKWAVGLAADGNTASQQWSTTFHSQCQY